MEKEEEEEEEDRGVLTYCQRACLMTLKETAKYLRIDDYPLETRLRNLSTLTAALTAQYFVAKNKAAVFFQLSFSPVITVFMSSSITGL